MSRFWRNNNLSIVLFAMFAVALLGHSIAGWLDYNQEQQDHREPTIGYVEYLGSGDFIESVFENWESEFLQDGVYVLLTVYLVQRGSSESKDPDKHEAVDDDPRAAQNDPDAPWPVRRGGAWLALYKNSLVLAFMALFAFSFIMHDIGGARAYSREQVQNGSQPVSALEYLGTSRFWFESLQNWQSEFLAVFSIVVLSIFLRQQGSPESKPVASPHSKTGEA